MVNHRPESHFEGFFSLSFFLGENRIYFIASCLFVKSTSWFEQFFILVAGHGKH